MPCCFCVSPPSDAKIHLRLGFRLDRECQRHRLPSDLQERRAAKRSFPGSGSRKNQLQLTERVSAGRGTNVKPRPEDWTEDGGLEHSAGSARAACGEQSQIRSGSIPSWATFGRANQSLGSDPGNRERAPKISMAGNLGKARQRSHYQPALRRK